MNYEEYSYGSQRVSADDDTVELALIEGLDNHIVVESDNMLMILNKADEQNLKKYVVSLEEKSPGFFKK